MTLDKLRRILQVPLVTHMTRCSGWIGWGVPRGATAPITGGRLRP
jgi:hypothetical protein